MKSKKFITLSLFALMGLSVTRLSHAAENLLKVTGDKVFEDHSLNQYDDVENPPQGFEVQIPEGYYLNYYATPVDDGRQCSVRVAKRIVYIEAKNLETDEGGCYAFLIFLAPRGGRQKTVSYYIEQTGT